jgi:hypothetical protein
LYRDFERVGKGVQDPNRGLVKSSLDLAEVRVRDVGHAGHLSQRELGVLPLLTNESPEGTRRYLALLTLPWVRFDPLERDTPFPV